MSMDLSTLQTQLSGLPVPQIRYYGTIGSTNDEALSWAMQDAQDGCLVVADQQTQGRGRLGRHWITNSGAALAFSLILKPAEEEMSRFSFFSPLGALALSEALQTTCGLDAHIKWPNDVLLAGKKTAGILVEAAWLGDRLQGLIIGIGLNITAQAVPPATELMFPATSVEQVAGQPVDRWKLLRSVLVAFFEWRAKLNQPIFFKAWEERLAFKGKMVRIEQATGLSGSAAIEGRLVGLDPGGNLLIQPASGTIETISVGDVHLRLAG